MSYTSVIIPTVESVVDNSGVWVWMTVWRVGKSVENAGILEDVRSRSARACGERRRPPHLAVRRASEEQRAEGQRQRVVMRKPTNMMPKPTTMFHEPRLGTGSVAFEM